MKQEEVTHKNEVADLDNKIDLLSTALQQTLKKAGVLREDVYPCGPELLNVAQSYYEPADELIQQIPSASFVSTIAQNIVHKDEAEKNEAKRLKFQKRCSNEIVRAANRGDSICNFAYYRLEVFKDVIEDMKTKGYQVELKADDDARHTMVVISW